MKYRVNYTYFDQVCYDSTFCENAISFGWLLWGFSIVRKNGMHL
jgi:hypothetical protein